MHVYYVLQFGTDKLWRKREKARAQAYAGEVRCSEAQKKYGV